MQSKLDDVAALRAMLRDKFPGTVVETAGEEVEVACGEEVGVVGRPVTGVRCLDEAGAARGQLLEVVGRNGGGLVVDGVLAFCAQHGKVLVLIDGADRFDPDSAGKELCEWILWLRCERVEQALKVADMILRDGNLGEVFLDLEGCELGELRRVASSTWYRLRGLAEDNGALFIVMTPEAMVGCADLRVAVSLGLEQMGKGACFGILREDLVAGLQGRVLRERRRRRTDGGEEEVEVRRLRA